VEGVVVVGVVVVDSDEVVGVVVVVNIDVVVDVVVELVFCSQVQGGLEQVHGASKPVHLVGFLPLQ